MNGLSAIQSNSANMLNQMIQKCNGESVHSNIIICNTHGLITDISEDLCTLLGYSMEEIIGRFIGVVMNEFMSFLHQYMLIPMYIKMTDEERQYSNKYLETKSAVRPLIIYTKHKKAIYTNITIKYENSNFIAAVNIKEQLDNSCIYTSELNPPCRTNFVKSNMDMVIIGIDIKNSTEYLVNKGVIETIKMHTKFHNQLVALIRNEYYPYIYVHEIMGDGFILVLNLEWSYHFPRFCASMAYSFLVKLHKTVSVMFRAGIAYGEIHYGYIDNHLRFFGETINRASRYESVNDGNSLTTDSVFHKKLLDEVMFSPSIVTETTELKGFGTQEVIHIPYDYDTVKKIKELSINSINTSPEFKRRSPYKSVNEELMNKQ